MVYRSIDWLSEYREAGQTIETFKQGAPWINWYSPLRKNTLYFYIMDEGIEEDLAAKLQFYLEAFFPGVLLKLVRPGYKIRDSTSGRGGKSAVKAILPTDFV